MSELKDQLKQEALSMSEEYLKKMVDDVERLGELLVQSTETPFDDMGLSALKMFKGELLKLIDQIDGAEG